MLSSPADPGQSARGQRNERLLATQGFEVTGQQVCSGKKHRKERAAETGENRGRQKGTGGLGMVKKSP